MYAPGRRWRPQQEPANPSNNHFNFKKEDFLRANAEALKYFAIVSVAIFLLIMLYNFNKLRTDYEKRRERENK